MNPEDPTGRKADAERIQHAINVVVGLDRSNVLPESVASRLARNDTRRQAIATIQEGAADNPAAVTASVERTIAAHTIRDVSVETAASLRSALSGGLQGGSFGATMQSSAASITVDVMRSEITAAQGAGIDLDGLARQVAQTDWRQDQHDLSPDAAQARLDMQGSAIFNVRDAARFAPKIVGRIVGRLDDDRGHQPRGTVGVLREAVELGVRETMSAQYPMINPDGARIPSPIHQIAQYAQYRASADHVWRQHEPARREQTALERGTADGPNGLTVMSMAHVRTLLAYHAGSPLYDRERDFLAQSEYTRIVRGIDVLEAAGQRVVEQRPGESLLGTVDRMQELLAERGEAAPVPARSGDVVPVTSQIVSFDEAWTWFSETAELGGKQIERLDAAFSVLHDFGITTFTRRSSETLDEAVLRCADGQLSAHADKALLVAHLPVFAPKATDIVVVAEERKSPVDQTLTSFTRSDDSKRVIGKAAGGTYVSVAREAFRDAPQVNDVVLLRRDSDGRETLQFVDRGLEPER